MNTATQITNEQIWNQIASLRTAVADLMRVEGRRLNAIQLAERLGVSAATLARWRTRADFPKRGKDGKWALADIIEWEAGK